MGRLTGNDYCFFTCDKHREDCKMQNVCYERKMHERLRYYEDMVEDGTVFICAVRYAIGRRTYMPGLVQQFIRPLLPELSTRTLKVMQEDISPDSFPTYPDYWGDEKIDKPGWMKFLADIEAELERRKDAS